MVPLINRRSKRPASAVAEDQYRLGLRDDRSVSSSSCTPIVTAMQHISNHDGKAGAASMKVG